VGGPPAWGLDEVQTTLHLKHGLVTKRIAVPRAWNDPLVPVTSSMLIITLHSSVTKTFVYDNTKHFFFHDLIMCSTVSTANTEPLRYVTPSVPCLIRRSYQEPDSCPRHLKRFGHNRHFGPELV